MRHRIHSLGVCGSRVKSRHSPYGLDDFMSSIVVFVLKTGRGTPSELSRNDPNQDNLLHILSPHVSSTPNLTPTPNKDVEEG